MIKIKELFIIKYFNTGCSEGTNILQILNVRQYGNINLYIS